jgi:hypothetical protein
MSTTILKFMIPPQVNEPRGALWAATVAALLHAGWWRLAPLGVRAAEVAGRIPKRALHGLAAVGQGRARSEMLDLAERTPVQRPGAGASASRSGTLGARRLTSIRSAVGCRQSPCPKHLDKAGKG